MLLEKLIANTDRILLSLALVISEGKLGDAMSLTAWAGEELKMQGAPFAVGSVHVRAGTWRLGEACRVFEEMKGCCEAQQEFHIRAFSTGRFCIEKGKCILRSRWRKFVKSSSGVAVVVPEQRSLHSSTILSV